MKKIISLFKRDYEGTRQIYNEIVPGAEWVAAGEGIATVKIDGTSVMVRDGKLFKRYDAKAFTIGPDGQRQPWNRVPPAGFEPAQEPDPVTGHWPGWVLVGDEPGSKYHRASFAQYENLPNGTYELIGDKIQGNPYKLAGQKLVRHGEWIFDSEPPRTYDELKAWFENNVVEGVVWHRLNGEMVKIKRRDFGLKWPEVG